MKATVVRPAELGPVERQRWAAFGRVPALGSPFLSAEFARIIGELRADARVAVIDDGHLAGAFFRLPGRRRRCGLADGRDDR